MNGRASVYEHYIIVMAPYNIEHLLREKLHIFAILKEEQIYTIDDNICAQP